MDILCNLTIAHLCIFKFLRGCGSSTLCIMGLKLCTLSIRTYKVVVRVSALSLIISLGCWMAKNGSDHYFERCRDVISLCKLISQKLNKILK